jgi:Protein of unknown function (DUF3352)
MTDQDPTQRYEPPAAPPPAEAPAFAPPAAPGAGGDAVPTAPVAAASRSRGSGGRLRWLGVGALVLVVGGVAAAATMLLTGDSGDPDVLAWAPADSLVYTELRLDLPGTQQAELAEVMSAFPGFDDQAAFPMKLNEVLDQLVSSGTDGEQSFSQDIDPWFGRQVSVSVGPLPASIDDVSGGARALVLASVTDAAKAQAWADEIVKSGDTPTTTTTETYNGTTITVVTPAAPGEAKPMAPKEAAYAVVGPVLAVGDLASVKAAIDTGGAQGLNTVKQFQEAETTVSGDRLALSYVDAEGLVDGAKALAGPAASLMPSLPAAADDLTWAVSAVRVQDGAFIIETRNPHLEALGRADPSNTTLASVLPPTTVFLAEGHDLGETLTMVKDAAATEPEIAEGLTQLDQALQIVGGWEAITGWMGEGGIAVTRDGEQVGGGIVITPTDATAAGQLFTKLRGLLALAGGQAGITVTDEDYAGTTITTIHLGSLEGVDAFAAPLPADLSISFAATEEVVVLGVGTDFSKAVLDARTGATLAQTERFSESMAQAGTSHSALFWVDVIGLRGLGETQLSAEDKAEYEADLKPYLEAFDSVIGTFTPGTDLDRGTVIIRVSDD